MNNDLITILSLIIGTLGIAVTWWTFSKAGKELREGSARLRHLTEIVLRAMEDNKQVRLNTSESGEIVGRILDKGMATLSASASLSAKGEVIQRNHVESAVTGNNQE